MDKDYELTVFIQVINKYLDEIIFLTEESLKYLRANRDQVVYDLATKIYTQSGHKIELAIIRDIVNSRIEDLSCKLVAEQKHIEKDKAQMAEKARQIEQKRIVEETRLYAKQKHQIEEARRIVDKEGLAGKLFGGDQSKANFFVRVRGITSEQLGVEGEIKLESSFRTDLGADDLDLAELIMALEQEFEIEIPDEDAYEFHTVEIAVDYICQIQASTMFELNDFL